MCKQHNFSIQAITSLMLVNAKITGNIGTAIICCAFHAYIFKCSFFGSDGTTDVTRTMHFGTPSAFEKVHLLILCFHSHFKYDLSLGFD